MGIVLTTAIVAKNLREKYFVIFKLFPSFFFLDAFYKINENLIDFLYQSHSVNDKLLLVRYFFQRKYFRDVIYNLNIKIDLTNLATYIKFVTYS